MRIRTLLLLYGALFNALWLAHVFVVLALQGHYPIEEPTAWIAWTELVFCIALAGLVIERLLRMRERR